MEPGRARVTPRGEAGISIVNTAGIEIQDLVLTGDRAAFRNEAGIILFADAVGAPKFEHVVVKNGRGRVGFAQRYRGGWWRAGPAGFRDVRIADSVCDRQLLESGCWRRRKTVPLISPIDDAERPELRTLASG
jgi:hypothetical protein